MSACNTVCRHKDETPRTRTALIFAMRVISLFSAVLQFLTSSRFFLEICNTKELSDAYSQQADHPKQQLSLLHALIHYYFLGKIWRQLVSELSQLCKPLTPGHTQEPFVHLVRQPYQLLVAADCARHLTASTTGPLRTRQLPEASMSCSHTISKAGTRPGCCCMHS